MNLRRVEPSIPVLGKESDASKRVIEGKKQKLRDLKEALLQSFQQLQNQINYDHRLLDTIISPFMNLEASQSALHRYLASLLPEDTDQSVGRYDRFFEVLRVIAVAGFREYEQLKYGEVSSALKELQIDNFCDQLAEKSRQFVLQRKKNRCTKGNKSDPHHILVTQKCYAYCNNLLLRLEETVNIGRCDDKLVDILVNASDQLNVDVENFRTRINNFFDSLFSATFYPRSIKVTGGKHAADNNTNQDSAAVVFLKYWGCLIGPKSTTDKPIMCRFNFEEHFHDSLSGQSALINLKEELSKYNPIIAGYKATALTFESSKEETTSLDDGTVEENKENIISNCNISSEISIKQEKDTNCDEAVTEDLTVSTLTDGIKNTCIADPSISMTDASPAASTAFSIADYYKENVEENFASGWFHYMEDNEDPSNFIISAHTCENKPTEDNHCVLHHQLLKNSSENQTIMSSAILPISCSNTLQQNLFLLCREMIDCMRLDLVGRAKIKAAAHAFANAVIVQRAEFSLNRLVGIVNIIGMYFHLIICRQLNALAMTKSMVSVSDVDQKVLLSDAFSGIMSGNLPSIHQMEIEIQNIRNRISMGALFPHLSKPVVEKSRRDCQALVRRCIECLFEGFHERLKGLYPPICAILCNVRVTDQTLEQAKTMIKDQAMVDEQLQCMINLASALAKYQKRPQRWAFEEYDQLKDSFKKRKVHDLESFDNELTMANNAVAEFHDDIPSSKRRCVSSLTETSEEQEELHVTVSNEQSPLVPSSNHTSSSFGLLMNKDTTIKDSYKTKKKLKRVATTESSSPTSTNSTEEAANGLLSLQQKSSTEEREDFSTSLIGEEAFKAILKSLRNTAVIMNKCTAAIDVKDSGSEGSAVKRSTCQEVKSIYSELKRLIKLIEDEYDVVNM